MIREAGLNDVAPLQAYLRENYQTTMFMRGNLRDYGLGNRTDDFTMRYFLELSDGAIIGVCAVANYGTIMGHSDDSIAQLAEHVRAALGTEFEWKGVLGSPATVDTLRAEFSNPDAATDFNDHQPLFALDLAQLTIPDQQGTLIRPAMIGDLPLLTKWGYDYVVEVGLKQPGVHSRNEAKLEAEKRVGSEKYRIFLKDGEPVAQTGFNAVMPDSVQVGAVYTPPNMRKKGYGRMAVALHLSEAKQRGVEKAILFAANEYAARAYQGIGFEQVGHYVITMFKSKD